MMILLPTFETTEATIDGKHGLMCLPTACGNWRRRMCPPKPATPLGFPVTAKLPSNQHDARRATNSLLTKSISEMSKVSPATIQ
jgi:hypothetical protein